MHRNFNGVCAVLGDLLDHAFHAANISFSAHVAVDVIAQGLDFQKHFVGRVFDLNSRTFERIATNWAALRQRQLVKGFRAVAAFFVWLGFNHC